MVDQSGELLFEAENLLLKLLHRQPRISLALWSAALAVLPNRNLDGKLSGRLYVVDGAGGNHSRLVAKLQYGRLLSPILLFEHHSAGIILSDKDMRVKLDHGIQKPDTLIDDLRQLRANLLGKVEKNPR